MSKLEELADIKHDTWQRVMREQYIRLSTAKSIADVLTEKNLLCLLHPTMLANLAADYGPASLTSGLPDWEPLQPLSGCETASNGLCYFVWKLKHRLEDERFARAKRYDLSRLPTKEQNRLKDYLARHGNVCNRLPGPPRFPQHVTTVPDPQRDAYWVVDEWTPGRVLLDLLYKRELPAEKIPRMMWELAEGLKALHDVRIIRRELSPKFIVLQNPDGAVLLTDFELGKLLDEAPTVRGEFPYDPYRAPEAGGGPLQFADRHVDFYSWGRILVHAASGQLPPAGEDERVLEKVKLPPKVRELVLRCVSLDAAKRPPCAEEVLKALRGWK